MIKIVISGYGKVGQEAVKVALADQDVELAAVVERKGHPLVGNARKSQEGIWVTDNPTGIDKAHVLLEFSTPAAVMEHLDYAANFNVPMLIATTGLDLKQKVKIRKRALQIVIVMASNVTLGMNTLFVLVPKMAKVLFGAGWTGAITETHREGKKDAPSGTALTIVEGIRGATGKEIPAFSIRAGNVVGVHRIELIGPSGEMIEITHRVQSREDFALAAISLAKMMSKLPPGFYEGSDLIMKELA